ncbi:MAG TPA: hypothetical protein VFU07_08430 [Candidatus Lumbricidophila sp.]|nr:hypothetical protein [Candidatus Lumbricidophila sp.]
MKSVGWFVLGIAAGFVAAHQVNQTAQGRRFFEELNEKARAFGQTIAESYHEREAQLRATEASDR